MGLRNRINNWVGSWITAASSTTTYIKNFATFRFGQSITSIEQAVRRNPYLKWFCYDIYELAFSDGFEIQDENDLRVDLSDQIDKLRWLDDFTQISQKEAIHGAVTTVIFEETDEFDEPYSLLKSFRPARTKFSFDLKGRINKVEYQDYLHEGALPLKKYIEGEDLDNVKHFVLRPNDDYWYRGIPQHEDIWDLAHAANSLLEAAMVASTRMAYGVMKATIYSRGDSVVDSANEQKTITGLKNLDAGDTSVVMWAGFDPKSGQPFKDELDINTGNSNYNYQEKLDMYHSVMAFKKGVPRNVIDGIYQGETTGAEVTKSLLYSKLNTIRDSWTIHFEDILKRWCELNNQTWEEGYHLVWKLEEGLSEKEQAEIDEMKARTYATFKAAAIMTLPEIREVLDLDPEIDVEQPANYLIEARGLDKKEEEENENEPG